MDHVQVDRTRRYHALGVSARLRQDQWQIHGLERIDEAHHKLQEYDRRHQRERNMSQDLSAVGAIESRGFDQLIWDILQGCQEDDHAKAESRPDGDGGHALQGIVGEPPDGRARSEDVDECIEQAHVLVQDHLPRHHRRNDGHHTGQVKEGTKEAASGNILI